METATLEVPQGVDKVTISVGLPNPQDGDSRRSVRVSNTDFTVPPAETYFEQETEGSGPNEGVLVAEVITALQEQGFQETNRQDSPSTEGCHIWLERQ